jgi:SAM-dependent methyltransferase
MSMSDPRQSSEFFDAAYRDRPPWNIGEPQPALIALLDAYPPTGPVLDVGCGTGDLALFLAERGLSVLGVDLAQARAKAAKRSPGVGQFVEFRVADRLYLTRVPEAKRVTGCRIESLPSLCPGDAEPVPGDAKPVSAWIPGKSETSTFRSNSV